MTTFNDMVEEVLINLEGFTLRQDRTTYLTAAITSSGLTMALASGDNIGKGIVEIDDELIHIDSVDRSDRSATISPFGRGYRGTTAAAHTLNTKVTFAPSFPRLSVKRAINDTIRAMGTQLLIVDQTTFTYNSAITTYELSDGSGNPLNIENILTMSWQDIGPSKEWINVRRYTFDPKAESGTWGANAQTVTIGDYITSGRTVKVNYVKQPSAFTASNQVFTTQTGYPETARDVVILGTAYRLLTYLDPARASQISPQADEIDAKRPFGSANTAVRQIFSLYQQRLREEIQAFQGQYPTRVHYSRQEHK